MKSIEKRLVGKVGNGEGWSDVKEGCLRRS